MKNDDSEGKLKERNRIYFWVGYHCSHSQKSMILWMTIDSHDDIPEEKPEAWRKSFSALSLYVFSVLSTYRDLYYMLLRNTS